MANQKKSDDEQLELIMDALAESVAQMSDQDVISEFGADPPPHTRDILRAAAKRHAQAKLRHAREQYELVTESLLNGPYELPKDASGRRTLLGAIIAAKPDLRQVVFTAQHRDFKDLTDADIESFLKQLDQLGVLEAFRKSGK